jgi:hypothetical protein
VPQNSYRLRVGLRNLLVDDNRSAPAATVDESFARKLAKRFVNRRSGGLIVLGKL